MAYISKDQVLYKMSLKKDAMQEKIDNIRGAVMMGKHLNIIFFYSDTALLFTLKYLKHIAYPMGLPEYDLVRVYLEGSTDDIQEAIDPETATLWWAGKEFFRDQLVRDRVGKNEKTKIMVKLTKGGSGPPAREPVISEGRTYE